MSVLTPSCRVALRLGACLVSLAGLALVPPAAAGDMVVIESNIPEIAVNSRLPEDIQPMLPPGKRIKVLRPDNSTEIFEGSAKRASSAHALPYGGVRGDKD
jgi:hypothetical protein